MSVGVSLRHLSVLDTILDLIPKPAVCGQEIQCRKQGIVAAVHVPADLQEHGAVYVHGYLVDIDKQAEEMFSRLIKQMAEHEGVTEKLKADNQMKWVVQMNNIRSRAAEIVNNDLIYT